MRAVAALLVVIFHYGCTVFPFSLQEHFFRRGNLAVSFFFVLSGFVMYWSYSDKQIAYRDFLKKRIARIWPLYVFAILLALSYPVYLYATTDYTGQPGLLKSVVLNISLLQAYIPGYALSVNSPGWSLSVEMFFYMLFPLLIMWARRDAKQFVKFAWVFFILSQLLHIWLVRYLQPVYPSAVHEFIYYQPLFHLNQFVLGIAGGYYASRITTDRAGLYAFLAFLALVLFINYMPSQISLHNGLTAPLCLLLILFAAQMKRGLLFWMPFVFLGEISFGIYILQEPLHFYCMKMNDAFWHLSEVPFFYFYIFILVFSAFICYYLVELPCRRFMMR
jgi:peptidoglycan/LPS O-acetylase OafA/YrhL